MSFLTESIAALKLPNSTYLLTKKKDKNKKKNKKVKKTGREIVERQKEEKISKRLNIGGIAKLVLKRCLYRRYECENI